uniref:CBL-interacting serine/threonine-protein kinase 4 n=1 Tax=Rhizophora mucronata TaxID=61149 RepID=A0A2P2NKN7_RHIMU
MTAISPLSIKEFTRESIKCLLGSQSRRNQL